LNIKTKNIIIFLEKSCVNSLYEFTVAEFLISLYEIKNVPVQKTKILIKNFYIVIIKDEK
jgi:hypothetical protein